MSSTNTKVEIGQVYSITDADRWDFSEEILTIKSIEMLDHGMYFTCEENEGTWSIHLLEDKYILVEEK